MKLRNKILEAVHRSDMSIEKVTIRPLRDPASWGCKEEAYCVHILTHKRRKPDGDNYWDCYEDEVEGQRAVDLAHAIEALGKIEDGELYGDANFYTRQVYVGDSV